MHVANNNTNKNVPFFSIGIAAYNREKYIKRCIMSCLEQSFNDFEIVVVDDGSTDQTVEIVRSIKDPRIRVILNPENLGQAGARQVTIDNSRGKWLITFDSDWELLPGALEDFYNRTQNVSNDIGVLGARVIYENGSVTPRFVPDSVIDYEDRIKWTEREGGTDYLRCIRREVYHDVGWPADKRGAVSYLFALDLAKATKQHISETILAKQYFSEDSIHRGKGIKHIKSCLHNAPGMAGAAEEYLERHGQTLKRLAPKMLYSAWRRAAKHHFLCGNRVAGTKYFLKCLSKKPYSLRLWLIFLTGIIDKRLTAFAHLFSKK